MRGGAVKLHTCTPVDKIGSGEFDLKHEGRLTVFCQQLHDEEKEDEKIHRETIQRNPAKMFIMRQSP